MNMKFSIADVKQVFEEISKRHSNKNLANDKMIRHNLQLFDMKNHETSQPLSRNQRGSYSQTQPSSKAQTSTLTALETRSNEISQNQSHETSPRSHAHIVSLPLNEDNSASRYQDVHHSNRNVVRPSQLATDNQNSSASIISRENMPTNSSRNFHSGKSLLTSSVTVQRMPQIIAENTARFEFHTFLHFALIDF